MSYFTTGFKLTLPAALLPALAISRSVELGYADGPSRWAIGYPLLWATQGPTSLSIYIAPLALLGNVLVYFIAVLFFGVLAKRLLGLRPPPYLGIILWGLATAALLSQLAVLAFDPRFFLHLPLPDGAGVAASELRLLPLLR